MSGYKTFAIWGAGVLGTRIAEHLLNRKVNVIILTRPVCISSFLQVKNLYLPISRSPRITSRTSISLPKEQLFVSMTSKVPMPLPVLKT
jgi:ketopantoate reductase